MKDDKSTPLKSTSSDLALTLTCLLPLFANYYQGSESIYIITYTIHGNRTFYLISNLFFITYVWYMISSCLNKSASYVKADYLIVLLDSFFYFVTVFCLSNNNQNTTSHISQDLTIYMYILGSWSTFRDISIAFTTNTESCEISWEWHSG